MSGFILSVSFLVYCIKRWSYSSFFLSSFIAVLVLIINTTIFTSHNSSQVLKSIIVIPIIEELAKLFLAKKCYNNSSLSIGTCVFGYAIIELLSKTQFINYTWNFQYDITSILRFLPVALIHSVSLLSLYITYCKNRKYIILLLLSLITLHSSYNILILLIIKTKISYLFYIRIIYIVFLLLSVFILLRKIFPLVKNLKV